MGRRRGRRAAAALAAALAVLGPWATPGASEPGSPDPGFGDGGVARAPLVVGDESEDGFSFGGEVLVEALPDGRVLAAASANGDVVVVRFLADGRLDAAFGANGRLAVDFGGSDQVGALGVRPDGRIVVVGGTSPSGLTDEGGRVAIARVLATGALDPSFGTGGVVTDDPGGAGTAFAATGAAVAPDGAVVAVGVAFPTALPGAGPAEPDLASLVARYDPEGRRDPAFGGGRSVRFEPEGGFVSAVALAGADVVLAVTTGAGLPPEAPPSGFLVRLAPTGAFDPSFGAAGRAGVPVLPVGVVGDLAVAPGGEIVAAGQSGPRSVFVARFAANGAPDAAFGDRGRAEIAVAGADFASADVAVAASGAVVVQADGFALGDDGAAGASLVARLRPDGSPDRSFGTNGRVALAEGDGSIGGRRVAVQAGEAVLVGEVTRDFTRPGPTGPVLALTRLLGSGPSTPAPETTTRLAGADRVATSVALSRAAFADAEPEAEFPGPQAIAATPSPTVATGPSADPSAPGADGRAEAGAVVVARADDYADALVAAPLAAALDAPVLLTARDRLDPRVLAGVRRILPEDADVYVLGGPGALGPTVGTDLEVAGYAVRRFAGADRYETSVRAAATFFATPATVGLASGRSFADALSGGARAASLGAPLVLTEPAALPSPVAAYLQANRRFATAAFVVGGTAAVSDAAVAAAGAAIRDAPGNVLAEAELRLGA